MPPKKIEPRADSDNQVSSLRYDSTIEEVTNDFAYDDTVVCLRAGQRVFKVARSRLTQRSPVFCDMFSLPHSEDTSLDPASAPSETVVLHDDPADFAHYLWFIHADYLDVRAEIEQMKPSTTLWPWPRCDAIARIAHKYQALPIVTFAVQVIYDKLDLVMSDNRNFVVLQRACYISSRLASQIGRDTAEGTRCRNTMRRMLYQRAHSSFNELDDIAHCIPHLRVFAHIDLLAHAYYYLLVYRADQWQTDPHVDAGDRQRLLSGFYAMHRKGICPQPEPYNKDRSADAFLEIYRPSVWSLFHTALLQYPKPTLDARAVHTF